MKTTLLSALLLCTLACATAPTPSPATPTPAPVSASAPQAATPPSNAPAASDYRAILEDPSRLEGDRALDANRKPAELLAFYGVKPGMKAADIGAGGGYTTELLSRAVGPSGVVYSQNSQAVLSFAGKPWDARLARTEMKNVVRVVRDFDDPLPPEAHDLDVVVIHAIYHDTVGFNVDRDKMNRSIFAALKPGGAYIVVDSSARAGSGVADVKTLHRIDEQFVLDEVQKVGFRLESKGEFLRNPADTRDWSASPSAAKERRGTGDRFVFRFVKPT